MQSVRLVRGVLLFIVFSSFARADDDLFELSLEQLLQVKVTSATRHPESLIEIPATIYIISKKQIQAHGFRDLKDVLKFVPGVEYAYPHSWLQGGQRGFTGNWSKTKIMIDGIEVNLLYSGEAFIGHQFMMNNVERVEVIQGPGSSLYGADAYSGIINIVTKAPEDQDEILALNFRVDSGERDYLGRSLNIYSSQKFDDWRYQLSIGKLSLDDADFTDFVKTDSFSEPQANRNVRISLLEDGSNPYIDENEALNVNAILQFDFNEKSSLNFQAIYLEDEDGGGLESPEISFSNFKTIRNQELIRIEYLYLNSDQNFSLKLKAEHHNSDEFNDLNFRELVNGQLSELYIFDIVDSQESIYEAQIDFASEDKRIYTILGLGYRDKNLPLPDFALKNPPQTSVTDFATLIPFQSQDTEYLFAQTQFKSADNLWKAVIGLRKDEHSIYDAPVTTRLGINYKASDNLVTSLNYGEAFRAPTMFELETNPSLGPAKQKMLELSLKYQRKESSLQIAAYAINADDLIVTLFDSSQSENFTSVNEGRVDIEGVEVLYTRQSKDKRIDAWIDWKTSTLEENLSRWQAGFLYEQSLSDNRSIGLSWRYFGKTETQFLDQDFNEQWMEVEEYNSLNLNWNYDEPFDIEGSRFYFSIRNLLDDESFVPNVRGNDPKVFLHHGINFSVGMSFKM